LIDLHCHTKASDGSLTPTQLVELAVESDIHALGIADHDTLGGVAEAVEVGEKHSLCVIPGIELSVNSPWGSLHLLGYFSKPDPRNVGARVAEIQSFRQHRNPKIVEKLQALGIPITLDDVTQAAGGEVVGRPHFARVLLKMGAVHSTQEAFNRYLKKGAPAYVDRDRLDIEEAIGLILADQGIPVLAHPGLIPVPQDSDWEGVIRTFAAMGGGGVEAYAPVHSRTFTQKMLELAKRYDLLVTGGTDFHGDAKPHLQIGIGQGDFSVPDELGKLLLQKLDAIPHGCGTFQRTC
jgi:predicted metal-dependent phosphoesterase TrpH